MQRITSMKDADFEHTEDRPNPLHPGGRAVTVRVSKVGGGTTDRAYDGRWLYRVTHAGSSYALMQGDDLNTGTPKTHRQVAELVLDFLPDHLSGLRNR